MKTELTQEVGARLRALREDRGIPREQLAIVLKMGAENVRHYEAGRTPLTLPMLPVIADLYGMTLAELVAALFEPHPPGHTGAHHDNGRHINGTANYNYTESAKTRFARPRTPLALTRELVAAAR